MSIANFFGLGKVDTPAAATPQNADASAATATAATTDAATAKPAATTSPLDEYTDLWQPSKTDDSTAAESDPFAIDQTKLGEAAGKLDFARVVKPEQLAAIARGGEDAVAAFGQALNQVAQATWQSNVTISTQLLKEALARNDAAVDARISSALKNNGIDTAISSNPVFKHPAAKPVVGAIARAMSAKFPDATPQELQEHAAKLLVEIAGGSKPQSAETSGTTTTANKSFDWDDWLSK